MRHHPPETILLLLNTEHPEVARLISQKLDQVLPERRLQNISLVPLLFEEFCRWKQIPPEMIQGNIRRMQHSDLRKEFMALLLLCYHPEQLFGMTRRPIRLGLVKMAAQALMSSKQKLSKASDDAVVYFKAYREFQQSVKALHEIIMDKYFNYQ